MYVGILRIYFSRKISVGLEEPGLFSGHLVQNRQAGQRTRTSAYVYAYIYFERLWNKLNDRVPV